MRKAEIVKSDLKMAQQKVADLESELKLSEEFEQEMKEKVENYAERFNAERSRNAVNPFD
jgi:molecular chaperone GrpE (heat shock protein)